MSVDALSREKSKNEATKISHAPRQQKGERRVQCVQERQVVIVGDIKPCDVCYISDTYFIHSPKIPELVLAFLTTTNFQMQRCLIFCPLPYYNALLSVQSSLTYFFISHHMLRYSCTAYHTAMRLSF